MAPGSVSVMVMPPERPLSVPDDPVRLQRVVMAEHCWTVAVSEMPECLCAMHIQRHANTHQSVCWRGRGVGDIVEHLLIMHAQTTPEWTTAPRLVMLERWAELPGRTYTV